MKKIAECRPHWTRFVVHGLVAVIFLLLGICYLAMREFVAFGLCIVVGIVLLLYIFVTYKFTYIFLTETKVEGNIGFIKSKTLTTTLSKVQNISISNGLIGKIFRYHTITVSDAGSSETEYVFRKMAHAKEFVNAAQEEITKQKNVV